MCNGRNMLVGILLCPDNGLEDQGILARFPAGVFIGCGTHISSYSVGTSVSFAGVKLAEA